MKRIPNQSIILLSLLLIFGSCVSHKSMKYLQYSENADISKQDIGKFVTPATYKLIPYDILFIRVITPDPQWSAIFNVTPTGSTGNVTGESAAIMGYPIDDNGNIDMPFVGKMNVGGKTLLQAKSVLDSVFKNYLNDAAITLRLVNNYVSVLGEVAAPGRYPLTKDRINIFEALSLSSDISQFGNRQKVKLIRPSAYGPLVKEFSLNDRSILTSEFYYIMPNDILYVEPLKGRLFQVNSSVWSMFISAVTSAMAITAFFRTF